MFRAWYTLYRNYLAGPARGGYESIRTAAVTDLWKVVYEEVNHACSGTRFITEKRR